MKKAVSLALAFLLIFSQVPVLTVPVGAEEITEGSGQVIQKVEAILEEETAEATDKVDLASPEQVDLGIETSNEDEGEALDEAGTDVPEKEQSAEIPEAEKTAHKETDNLSNFSVLVDGEALEDFFFDGTVEEQTIKLTKQQLANTAFALKYDACEDAVLKILRNEQADIAGFTEAVRVQRKPITVAAFDDVDEINAERYSFSFLLGHLDETGVFVQTSYYVLHVEPIAEAVQEKDENANSQAEKETAKQDGITDQDDTEQNEQIETSENDPDYITDIQILHNGAPLPADFFSFQKECEKQKAVIVADELTENLTVSIGIRMGDNVFFRILRDGQQTVTNFQTDVKIDGDTMTVKPFTNELKDNYYCGKYSFEFSVGTKYDSNADGVIDASDEFESISSYTLDVEIIPAFYRVRIVNQDGAVLKNVNGPTGLELYDNSYSMTVSSSTISFNLVQTRPGIGTSSAAVSLYVGDNGPFTKNVTASRPVQIDLADYTTEGSNIARIPVRMDNSTLGISRTIIFYVTYNDPSIPVVSDLQGFECDKNTEQKLAVELSCENEGTLTYQWYARSKQLYTVVAEPIAGAIERELTVPTDWAGTMYYSCEVTNTVTVDGVEKQYKSNTNEAAVTVKLSEVSSPEIKEQPGTYALLNQGQDYSAGYKIAYTRGQVLDTVFVRLRYPEFGTSYTAQFACKDSGTGEAKELKGTTILVDQENSNFWKYTSSDAYIDYAFIPSAPLPVGEYDIYCVITAADKENAEKTASTTSDSVHITVTKPETTLSGTGTQTDPYMITCGDDLDWVREQVAGGNPFTGSYFKFKNDVTLPEPWQPIGCTKDGTTNIDSGRNLNPFSGIIDGDNFTLTVPEGSEPLLGYVRDATVQNLNIYGKQINGYGLVNNFEGVGLQGSAIVIDHCTLKSGTQTLKSGFLGANITSNHYAGTSAGFTATIRNCTVEKDVIIGYTGTYDRIGSIAGRFQGTIENCVSYATVQGTTCVGGLVGSQDQAMGKCVVSNSSFHGSVTGSGSYVGGIVGSGYNDFGEASAPNGGRPTIQGCSSDGTVVGASCVGGILGGDQYVAQTWDNVISYVIGNTFTGTVSGNNYVGGIIGYYNSLNRYDNVSGNSYSQDCGAQKGIGFVKYLDTSCENPGTDDGTVVFSTAGSTANCPHVQWCSWKSNHNRTDDPLGADADKLCRVAGGSTEPICYQLTASGTYKTEFTVGDELDLTGIVLTASWSNGTTTEVALSDVAVEGYDQNKVGIQTITLKYGDAVAYITVTVKPESVKITVSVSILGDEKHGAVDEPHGLARGGLTAWAEETGVEADTTETVWDVLQRVAKSKDIEIDAIYSEQYGSYYIRGVNGLREKDNGENSGWMYTVNGKHPEVGVSARFVNENDQIILHYTDDYTYEEDGENYGKEPPVTPKPDKANATELLSGKSTTLKVLGKNGKVLGKNDITWTLKDPQDSIYATISATGTVKAKTVLTKHDVTFVGTLKGSYEGTVEQVVTILPKVTQVEIWKDGENVTGKTLSLNAAEEETLTLTAKVYPDELAQEVTWKSSNTKIAQIDAEGTVSFAGKTGTVTVTATSTDGSHISATVKLQVGVLTKSVTITEPADHTLRSGKSLTLKATTDPVKPTVSGVTFKLVNASDSAYVSVSTSGKVSAKTVNEPHVVKIYAVSKDAAAVESNEIILTILPKKVQSLILKSGDKYVTNGKVVRNVNEELTLKAYTLDTTDGAVEETRDVTWTSSNTKVATIDETGKVTCVKTGTVKLTATADKKTKAAVTLKVTNLVNGITIVTKNDKDSMVVASGKSLTLKATVQPANASQKAVTWSMVSGSSYAKISGSGVVSAKKGLTSPVTVIVKAVAKDGSGMEATQEITINPVALGVTISDVNHERTTGTLVWNMTEADNIQFSANVYPVKAVQAVTWKSSNAKIAAVDGTGKVTCYKAGTVTITATAKDGSGKKASFKLNIIKKLKSLTLEDQTVEGGKSLQLKAILDPVDPTNKKLTWTVSSNNVGAKISSSGKLTTKKVTKDTKVMVTVSSNDGTGLTATCFVTITPSVKK